MKKAVLSLIFIVLASFTAQAQTTDTSVPPLINYQGLLADANGNPLIGTKKLTFNIYDAASGGNLIWGPQVFDGVPLIGGKFNVILGSTDTAGRMITSAFSSKNRYLGIKVDSNTEIAPRQQVLSTPFAIQAENATKADVAKTVRGTDLYVDSDNGNVHINNVLRLKPTATAPSNASEGDIYVDSNDHKFKVYNGEKWINVISHYNDLPSGSVAGHCCSQVRELERHCKPIPPAIRTSNPSEGYCSCEDGWIRKGTGSSSWYSPNDTGYITCIKE
jgi:hypothetical protein